MQEIIAHTPRWVFALFIVLLALGLQQTRGRNVSLPRLILLPLAMLGLSFYGVWGTFGGSTQSVACWLGAALTVALACQGITFARGARYVAETRSIVMPGSWLPLILMMGIFFTKYGVGIALAQHGELRETGAFVVSISLVYGLWSGIFFGRALQIVSSQGRRALA